VVIVSADKDLMQLVGDQVLLFDSMRGRVFGPPEVEAKLGVPPVQVRDLLALMGDSSDNVPGVPSVGPKTAVALLAQYGTLDGIYAKLDQVKRRSLRAKLEQHKAQAYLSRDLVTLRQDLDFDVGGGALDYDGPDASRLRPLFDELEFHRLLAKLTNESASTARSSDPAAATPSLSAPRILGASEARLEQLRESLVHAGAFAVTCLGEHRGAQAGLVGLGFAWDESGLDPNRDAGRGEASCAACYVPLGHRFLGCPSQIPVARVVELLGPLLEDAGVSKYSSDTKRDVALLARHGVLLRGVEVDSALASYLLDPDRGSHALHVLAASELGLELEPEADLLGSGRARRDYHELEPSEAGGFVCMRAQALLLLAGPLERQLEQAGCLRLLRDLELPLANVLAEMEGTGVRVDRRRLARLATQAALRLKELEARCHELASREFNVASPRQLESILFDELKLPVIKRTKTARSTDHDVLEELSAVHELPAAVLEHRSIAKLKSTYLDALPREIDPKTGRVHTLFGQVVAATGRLSSSEPNLQNIPIRDDIGRQVREAFVAQEGWSLLCADYSQIELRLLAHLSQDSELLAAFASGQDVHVRTACAIFGAGPEEVTRRMRAQAKTVNFAVIYGQTQFALARSLGIPRAEAARYIKAFFERYAGVRLFLDQTIADARSSGLVRTICGRLRRIPDLRSQSRARRQAAERVACNSPIQGSAADVIKLAMVESHRKIKERGLRSRMLLTVHDELVFEAPPEEREQLEDLVRSVMENALKLSVPLVVELGWGSTWAEAH
ncbi:MAG: DNA polymerase I, partial [Proteobacteria bacterium]|nr:DNA polymerase I [Pseudomonadota bacterium]